MLPQGSSLLAKLTTQKLLQYESNKNTNHKETTGKNFLGLHYWNRHPATRLAGEHKQTRRRKTKIAPVNSSSGTPKHQEHR